MNLIKNLSGPLLVFLGAVSLSFGGLIVKSFEGATLWQILFWRSVFFSITVLLFLLITYKKKLFNSFYLLGFIFSNLWIFFFKRKNFLNYIIFNNFGCCWCFNYGWKFSISRRINWKFSCILNADYICNINNYCKKIPNYRHGSSTICCRYMLLFNWLFSFKQNHDFIS